MSSSSDDPADWREAVDAGSGKIYYYHRKTRVSSWEKPMCLQLLDDEEEDYLSAEEEAENNEEEFRDVDPERVYNGT